MLVVITKILLHHIQKSFAEKVGPNTGISLKKGIFIGLKIGASLSSGFVFRKDEVKKLVSPRARILIATPEIIWSTRYFITRSACNNPNKPPTIIANIKPIIPPKREPNTAPEKAPTKSIPSMPIFIIATLSERMPANAAKAWSCSYYCSLHHSD